MLLRRLELFGFKSFAKRTKLEFGPGITALVGPNGSGKSNIADAIRWALGEQRLKLLRCEKIEDLIHLGPDKHRSPGFCEVVLILDNSSGILPLDYSEVEVSRRAYRSGESEFKLNRTRCRLKDIQELFLDTGLGRDTYALINQGQVENLLTMKAQERRLMLEEAAGILKYRYRKGEVLNKLAESEQNIMRLNDLLIELNHQLSLLEEEATQEKLYRQYREELKTSQIALALHKVNSLQKQREKDIQKLQEKQCRKQGMETKLRTLDAEIEKEKLVGHFKEEKLSEKRQNLAIIQASTSRLEESIALREKQNLSLQREGARKKQQQKIRIDKIAEIRSSKKEAGKLIEFLQQETYAVDKELESLTERMKQYQEKWQQKEEGLEADRDEAFEIIRRQSEGKNKWQSLSTRRESVKKSLLQAGQQLQNIERELSGLKKEKDILGQEQKKWASILIRTDKTLAYLGMEMEKTLALVENIQGVWQEKRRQLDRVQARLDFLRELERSFEGYYRGVQAILKNFNRGIYGTVADLFHVDKDLEKAIGVALGSTLQFLVVKNDNIAQEAIKYLLTKKLGRATFLPLNTIRGRNLPSHGQALLALPGVLGRAADLVTADTSFRPVVEFLLGQVIIVKDLPSARVIAQKGNYRFKIVSLNGEIITPGGAITGGTLGQSQIQLLSRKRETKELLKEYKDLSNEVQLLENTLTSEQEKMTVIKADVERSQEEKKQARIKLDEIERKKEDLDQRIEKNRKVFNTLRWEQKSAEGILEELEESIKLQEEELSQLEKEDRERQERLRKAEVALKEYKSKQEYRQEKITSLKVNKASLVQQLKAQEAYFKKLLEQHSEAQKIMLEEEKELNVLQREQENLSRQLELDHEILAKDKEKEMKLRQEVEELRAEKEENQITLSALQKESKEQRENIAIVVEETHQLEKKLTKLETSLAGIKRRLFADYRLSAAQAEKYKEEIVSVGKWHRRIAELEKKLDQLGNINLRAGEQYKQLQERYDFLTQQMEDLVEARKTLSELLQRIDSESKERLIKTFTEVQDSFQKVFQELFEGGKAQLSFTDTDNPLEAGLEIMVQPPGKKLQNILLLSGGEKALAAIAFLFGILQVKPSPFCVLDEIDASLDDVNAVRLGNFLRRYVGQIQFLLITHRQEIIKQADILYGIAMDKHGTSQFLSLDIGDDMVG
ncbi:MAG: chromosome segregation protein SMC [Firmicutes bacterium]|nr:chromosome segregation protein SMC [Bacillota bacterium]